MNRKELDVNSLTFMTNNIHDKQVRLWMRLEATMPRSTYPVA